MDVNIIEYSNPGHFTLVDSVCRIFSSDPANEVMLHVSEHHLKNGQTLYKRLSRENVSVQLLSNDLKNDALSIVITPDHDLITLEKLVKHGAVWMFIHNIDDWFDLSIKKAFHQAFAAIKDKNPGLAYYLVKRAIRDNQSKSRIIKAMESNPDSRFVVINQILKSELSKNTSEGKIKVIPFSVFDNKMEDKSIGNSKIRIAIPGILSQKRRDYIGVFKALEQLPSSVLEKIELDLLGGISPTVGERSEEVVSYAKKLINQGYPILLRTQSYIALDEFDNELSKSDIILGNLNIDQGGGSRYGKTKESGIPYTMIRAAKPGILPDSYSTLDGMDGFTLNYSNYNDLLKIIASLTDGNVIQSLKEKAVNYAMGYSDTVQLSKLTEHV